MSDNNQEVKLRDETLTHMREMMREAVRDGLRESITPEVIEQFWAGGFVLLQKQAAQHTGKFVLSSVGSVLTKLGIFLLLGGLVYTVGGWTALSSLFKSFFHGGTP